MISIGGGSVTGGISPDSWTIGALGYTGLTSVVIPQDRVK